MTPCPDCGREHATRAHHLSRDAYCGRNFYADRSPEAPQRHAAKARCFEIALATARTALAASDEQLTGVSAEAGALAFRVAGAEKERDDLERAISESEAGAASLRGALAQIADKDEPTSASIAQRALALPAGRELADAVARMVECLDDLAEWCEGYLRPRTGMGSGLHAEKWPPLSPGALHEMEALVKRAGRDAPPLSAFRVRP